MNKAITISKYLKDAKTLDYDFLYNEAVRYLQNLSGDTWTDYNLHDPGLTVLEYLCYALTDLAYRTDLDVEKVIYAESDIPVQHALFKPEIIYPTGPVTDNDLRRLIMSNHIEVLNCWIESSNFKNYYQLKKIYLLSSIDNLREEKVKKSNTKKLIKAVRQTLMKHRNLGEDFDEIVILKRCPLYVSGILTIQESFKPEDIMVEILMSLEELLNPAVKFEIIDEVLSDDTDLAKFYEGPIQKNNIIDERTLKDKKNTLSWSEVQDLLQKLEGVLRVKELEIIPEKEMGNTANFRIFDKENILKIEKDEYFYVDLGFLNKSFKNYKGIQLKRYQRLLDVDTLEIKSSYNYKINIKNRHRSIKSRRQEEPQHSPYNLRHVAQYNSIQKLFPRIYGLGKWGLPNNVSATHRLHASQLKGYLLLFEHFFSSYLAELSELPFLYAINSKEDFPKLKLTNDARKFFPFDIPDVDEVLMPLEKETLDNRQKIAKKYKDLYDKSNDFFERRSNALNHLLARFSESFDDRFHRRIYKDYDAEKYQWQLIEDKRRFLKNLETGGYRRGFGFNYHEKEKLSSSNISGFKKMICLKLGFPAFENYHLTNPLRAAKIIQIGETIRNKEEKDSDMNQGLGLKRLLYYGGEKQNYFILWNKEKMTYSVALKTPSFNKYIGFHHDDIKECEAAILRLQNEIAEINRHSLGFFMVEHLLLRPSKENRKEAFQQEDGITKDVADVFAYFTQITFNSLVINGKALTLKSKFYGKTNPILGNFDKILLKYGKDIDNWEEVPDGHGHYRLKLLGKRKEWVLRSQETYPNHPKAGNDKRPKFLICNYLNSLVSNEDKSQLKLRLQILPEKLYEEHSIDISEFYQERISFMLPDWVSHFFTKARKNYLENIIRTYLPVHLTPYFYWLNFQEMDEFQEYFEDWKIQLNDDKKQPNFDPSQLKLTDFLMEKLAETKLLKRRLEKNKALGKSQ